jgi:ubiquitin-protein ligase/stress response protein SCP2
LTTAKRIQYDLREIMLNPSPRFVAVPVAETNLHEWHFNLRTTDETSPYAGIVIHGHIYFPDSYPTDAPEIFIATPLPNANVVKTGRGTYRKTRRVQSVSPRNARPAYTVCASVLEKNDDCQPYSGWSPSYTTNAILTQLQALLFDDKGVFQQEWSMGQCRAMASQFVCKGCGHDATTSETVHPAFPEECSEGITAAEAPLKQATALAHHHQRWGDFKQFLNATPTKRAAVDSNGWTTVQRGKNVRAPITTSTITTSTPEPDLVFEVPEIETPAVELTSARVELTSARVIWSTDDVSVTNAALLGKLSYRTLVSLIGFLSPEDAARVGASCKYLVRVGEDGRLWRDLFERRFPYSQLTASTMDEWRRCFDCEVNQMSETGLRCFHTKAGFDTDLLGLPIDFTVNPRTRRVDYIKSSPELLSRRAFQDEGVRTTIWGEKFTTWLPVFLSPAHFLRARPLIEKVLLKLSPHWRTSRFDPKMTLEIVPKLLNTLIVLISDKGVHASETALEGYCMLHRLLVAMVEYYPGLQAEVRKRVENFILSERARVKGGDGGCPSLGDFLPLLSVCSGGWDAQKRKVVPLSQWTGGAEDAAESLWHAAAIPILRENFDRCTLWACKADPKFAKPEANVLGQGADDERLKQTLEATKVSRRLMMFHVYALLKVAPRAHLNGATRTHNWATHRAADYFYGRPPLHLRKSFCQHVQRILAVDSWEGFFGMVRREAPSPAQVTDMIKRSMHDSLRKRYHTKKTDFSKIHRSGVSRLLKCGESYSVSSGISSISLELGSDSSMILCGACLLYEDTRFKETVCYSTRRDRSKAVFHSGDTQVDGKSHHTMQVALDKLPKTVNRMFFTLCCCGGSNLSDFKKPSIKLADKATPDEGLCQYTLASAGRAATAVMACLMKEGDGWKVKALDITSRTRCCGNYGDIKKCIAQIRL